MNQTALFVGDTVFDTTVRVDSLPAADEKVVSTHLTDALGGVVTNAAIACSRTGTPTTLVSSVGSDAAGRECVRQAEKAGVDFRPEVAAGPSSRAVITIAEDGEKHLVLVPGTRMYPSETMCRDLSLASVGWLHTAVYDPAAARAVIARCAGDGVPWSVDLEPATFTGGIETLAGHLDGAAAVFCNTRAAQAVGPAPERVLFGLGARAVVFTDGARGARWCTPGGAGVSVPLPRGQRPVVDTTGAGDCLAGSFVGMMLETGDPLESLRYAVTAASYSCSGFGAGSAYATRAEVMRWYRPSENAPGDARERGAS
ncbi:carbohydrate kinase family protein [Streptomyces iconiensis]|uniref:Carbohydrate kinase family protein n=1 Tax=Streptomyces iconiensis TaxID=1384038 RepID=A0ABT6ZQZ8_9ACTN|nr:carbohydrate kinase family protein [Streptomyces iconiensis]MDJ1131481.1 carbohydrate kinase family protein [Streptomyces iconiensis]